MACGCTAACGCNVVAGAGILVSRIGDKFIITNTTGVGVPTFMQTTDPGDLGYSYIWHEVDENGILLETHYVWVSPEP